MRVWTPFGSAADCLSWWGYDCWLHAAGRHIGRPLQGYKVDLYFDGVAIVGFVQRAWHASPLQRNGFVFWWSCECFVRAAVEASLDPTKVPDNPRTQERSVTWCSGLFISVTYMNTFMPTPGPGPQARCGKGVWSPEDQGDRCRVPRSFGPSGAGREQVKWLKRNQQDDPATKGTRPAGLHLIRRLRRHLPLEGKA